jgi:predicted nicotinamide N-methyase
LSSAAENVTSVFNQSSKMTRISFKTTGRVAMLVVLLVLLTLVPQCSSFAFSSNSYRRVLTATTTTTSRCLRLQQQRHHSAFVVLQAQEASSQSQSQSHPALSVEEENDKEQETQRQRHTHTVDDIQCVEVTIELPVVGQVTILEATAASQETLVDIALSHMEEEEEDNNNNSSSDSSSDNENNGLCLSMGDPYGAVLWPAASAVATYLLQNVNATTTTTTTIQEDQTHNNKPLKGRTILEIGTGTGLLSLACALGGADRVVATDYEPVPLNLLNYAAAHLNHPNQKASSSSTSSLSSSSSSMLPPVVLEDVNIHNIIETSLFDLCDPTTPLPEADLVVAADILYEPNTGIAMAQRAKEALERGSRFVLGDSPGRPGRASFIEELKRLMPERARANEIQFVDSVGYTCDGDRHELICGKGSTSVSPIKGKSQRLDIAIIDLKPI